MLSVLLGMLCLDPMLELGICLAHPCKSACASICMLPTCSHVQQAGVSLPFISAQLPKATLSTCQGDAVMVRKGMLRECLSAMLYNQQNEDQKGGLSLDIIP